MSCQQGHMKTHPGVLTSTPSKAQTNDNDFAEDRKSAAQQDEKQGLLKSPEKGDSTDPLPNSVGCDAADEAMDTTA